MKKIAEEMHVSGSYNVTGILIFSMSGNFAIIYSSKWIVEEAN